MLKTNLEELRNQIDIVDQELIRALRKRFSLVELVGKVKKRNEVKPLDATRWQQVLLSRTKWGKELDLDPVFITNIFNQIHDYSLQIEGELCQK